LAPSARYVSQGFLIPHPTDPTPKKQNTQNYILLLIVTRHIAKKLLLFTCRRDLPNLLPHHKISGYLTATTTIY
jgi:hypothetical protein